MQNQYSVFLENVGTCHDRFCVSGYDREYSIEELFSRIKSIPMLTAVDIVLSPKMKTELPLICRQLEHTQLKVASIMVDTTINPIYKQGSFSSLDPGIRAKALDDTREAIDFANSVGCDLLTIWSGQDGYDSLFQADYIREREYYMEGIAACCNYRSDTRIALEYKMREPRMRSYISSLGITLLTIQQIGAGNLGVALDFGHSLFGGESPAESVALCKMFGDYLMHVHINDNYGLWDDDMIVGSNHTLLYLEFFYWLRRTGYTGFLTMDQYPYRENGRDAVYESIQWIAYLQSLVDNMDFNEVSALLSKKDATASSAFMRKILQSYNPRS